MVILCASVCPYPRGGLCRCFFSRACLALAAWSQIGFQSGPGYLDFVDHGPSISGGPAGGLDHDVADSGQLSISIKQCHPWKPLRVIWLVVSVPACQSLDLLPYPAS